MSAPKTQLLGIGTAVPPNSYTQEELIKLFGFTNRVTKKIFAAPHIEKRHLVLPDVDDDTGLVKSETQAQLNEKYRSWASTTGQAAIAKACEDAGIKPNQLDAIVCVTSTGWMVPGLTALYAREMDMPHTIYRADVVGMGCNAGLNGLVAINGWARSNEDKYGILVCCEVNSAMYCKDDTARDGIVNALFGDGAAALVVKASANPTPGKPVIQDFKSHMIPEEWGAMRFDWHEDLHRWRFFLSKDIPYVLGDHMHHPVGRLLKPHNLEQNQIKHWICHTGGGLVIDSVKKALELTEHDVRHSRTVLRDYGNLSSGSFLFSYERLVKEKVIQPGDIGVMITMGPGSQIETALLEWAA
jgi:predicted naringenin-chalcone synthase